MSGQIGVGGANELVIDLEAAPATPRHREPRMVPIDDWEREIELYGFKSRQAHSRHQET